MLGLAQVVGSPWGSMFHPHAGRGTGSSILGHCTRATSTRATKHPIYRQNIMDPPFKEQNSHKTDQQYKPFARFFIRTNPCSILALFSFQPHQRQWIDMAPFADPSCLSGSPHALYLAR
jgi:hypothetical protein